MLRVSLLLLCLLPALALAAPPGPLTDAQRQALAQIAPDPPPKEIVRNSHYWVSNEYRHDLFKEALTDLGGVHIGVGTDQNYLMAGWSRPELIVLMDFDTAIVRIHRAYKIAFAQAETPEAFLAFWDEKNAQAVMDRLTAEWGTERDGKRTVKAFKVARPIILRRLQRTLRAYGKRGVKTFLDDAEQYAYLRGLWQADRVIAVRGDLTADRCLQSIAQATKAAGLVVRSVYMSNAPQYFDFKAQFKANMAALPFDERSIFVHTLTRGAFGYADKYYHYNVQPAQNFVEWLDKTRFRKLTQILRYRTPVKGVQGFSIMQKTPADMPPPRKKTIKRRKKRKNLKK